MVTFTDGVTSGVVTKDIIPALGVKMIQVRVPATYVQGTDSLVVDLGDYGASKVSGILGFVETTAGSVVVSSGASGAQLGTTSVSSGILTYNSSGAASNTKGGTLIIFAF